MPVTDELISQALAALDVVIVRRLRDGGQKTVKLVARDGDELVLKVVAVGSSSPAALSRARREVELLGSIDDPHVVHAASHLVELGDPVEGAAWLEEFLQGEDLDALLTGPWTWADAAAMAADVAAGLSALHAIDVVHRDLSANNVRRLSSDGSYVVMDPGFARHVLRAGLTVGGQPGTAGYLSPEHLQSYSGVPTAASDVFGLGILMFLALTAEFPIPAAGDEADYLRRVAVGETQDLAMLRPDLSQWQVALVKRALHPQSARRFRNAARFAEALEAIE
jgi:serine/threonine-protein kinase